MKGCDFAKINLATLHVARNGLKSSELKKALAIVKIYREMFGRRWDEWFDRKVGTS